MTNPLRTPADYELFIYSLRRQFPVVRRSTVRFVRRGTTLARVVGELYFDKNVRLVVRERILYHRLPAVIDEYGYEVWQGDEKLYWYDPQPHPDDPTLQSTHPHHKHIPLRHQTQSRTSTRDEFHSAQFTSPHPRNRDHASVGARTSERGRHSKSLVARQTR
jgi:hypothetical protein